MFSAAVAAVRAQHQPRGARGNTVRIRRGYVLEDGLARIHRLSAEAMKERLHVIYVNDHGLDEPGIDLGGLFKEFWNDLSAQTFDVNFGLFRTNAESLLYPNPTSRTAHGNDHTTYFNFVGRVLGKALLEGITVEPRFVGFFLSYIRGG